MTDLKEKLKQKKLELEKETKPKKKDNEVFSRIEEIDGRKIYHTKIFNDFYKFGINPKNNNKFFIILKGLFNTEKTTSLSLFKLKEDDKFLGIRYRFLKLNKSFIVNYKEDGKIKTTKFNKVYYIEFKFKKGSVLCYLKGLSILKKQENRERNYYKSLKIHLLLLETEVYEFYGKKLPEGGIISKWIEKSQK